MMILKFIIILLLFGSSELIETTQEPIIIWEKISKTFHDCDPKIYNLFSKTSYDEVVQLLKEDHPTLAHRDKLLNQINNVLNRIKQSKEYLNEAGSYLREHKFFERDWRSNSNMNILRKVSNDYKSLESYYQSMFLRNASDDTTYFMGKFPNKKIRFENEYVKSICSESSLECIEIIALAARFLRF
jgi:hypothetical protein